jgi:hypothetical protein
MHLIIMTFGITTLSIMALGIRTLCIMALSIRTLSIMSLSIMTLNNMTPSILRHSASKTHSILTPCITKLNISTRCILTQHNSITLK